MKQKDSIKEWIQAAKLVGGSVEISGKAHLLALDHPVKKSTLI
jgi:hypothetical protein